MLPVKTKPGKLFIVSAPSGAGKTSLVAAVMQKLRDQYSLERIITYTTKTPRAGERHGVDYHFVSDTEFSSLLGQDFFIESSSVLGHSYGTPRSAIACVNRGTSGILVIDRLGAGAIAKQVKDAVLIWINVASTTVLEERLRRRATEMDEQLERRIAQGMKEIAQETQEKLYRYHITNDIFETAVAELIAIFEQELKG